MELAAPLNGATSGGLVVLLRAEEKVDLALGLEADHERAEAVAALHLALSEERDGLAQPAEARAHGGVVGGHGHGVGAPPLEELLHRALVALSCGTVVVPLLGPTPEPLREERENARMRCRRGGFGFLRCGCVSCWTDEQ